MTQMEEPKRFWHLFEAFLQTQEDTRRGKQVKGGGGRGQGTHCKGISAMVS